MNQTIRDLFPITTDTIYMDNAYLSPLAIPVLEASKKFSDLRTAGKAGRTDDWAVMMDKAKHKMAAILQCQPDQLALIGNTSEGTNIVANMVALQAGDNVIFDEWDHISNQLVWLRKANQIGFETRILTSRNELNPLDAYENALDAGTKIISISLVAHENGFLYDVEKLAELAHAHGAWLHVDAIQAVGTLQVDLSQSGIDFLTFGTYKWLLGPQGLGFFYIRAALLDQFEPAYSGWMQVKNWLSNPKDAASELYGSARKFQTATLDPRGIAELNAALDLILNAGIGKIETHNLALAKQLWEGLSELGLTMLTPGNIRSSIVTCEIPPEAQIGAALAEKGCVVTDRQGHLRFSPHFFNNEDEVNKAVALVKDLVL